MNFVDGGSVTTPGGFSAGATYAGLKTYAEDKLDLGILLSDRPSSVAGVFTTSAVRSPTVTITQERVSSQSKVRALVVNSGIANACVGEQGYLDAQEATAETARRLGLRSEEVLMGSTGIIGVELPMALVRTGISQITPSEGGGNDLARAIMTTDTHPKEGAVAFECSGKTVTIGGIAKGAGMIHPNMATMLSFLTSDADVEPSFLQRALSRAADSSFNMLSVDGDSSTNDTVLILANGAADAGIIEEGTPTGDLFQEALNKLCIHLTKELARDGEGASNRLIEVTVEGATDLTAARLAARTVVSSSLVKTAVHGADPNWGRIIAALGRSGAEVDEGKVALYVNDVCIMEDGRPIPFHRDGVVALMRGLEVSFRIKLNLGQSEATAWGCPLSEEYVTFNSAYTT
ncbi:MAG: bifunctional glutamate N-acetyltransferase/amino-acid acetyltransferase ArgJ [Dehalococcoidia bacterium]|nr:bifunctional glutamate N-acetyltransferase/amino-acid acetyltransferase ArgJ [Dehalococcoidia bacterium]